MNVRTAVALLVLASLPLVSRADDQTKADELGESQYVQNGDVKIHCMVKGEGPLLVLLHGFPDFWYTWRKQIPALAENHRVVAMDLRGFNKSSQPEGVEAYAMTNLVSDVHAVVQNFGKSDGATIVGHDWGGMIAWSYAMAHADKTERLIILNLPHPACLSRELANNPDQQKASAYARRFQQPDAASVLNAEGLAFWVQDSQARERYYEAFRRSSFEGMLNYYKANYPREPYKATAAFPKVKCPVLMIHGLKDTALLSDGLNGTWDQLENTLTLVTVPGANHFVQQDAPELVTQTMVQWLANGPR